jgi:hypothetical protein
VILAILAACSEFRVNQAPPVPPADPPADEGDQSFGDPPDWASCADGWYGQYYNLPADHPDVEPDPDAPMPDLADRDWWDGERRSFTRFDPSLDFGSGWWPLDDGIDGDPAYFAVRWTGWLRVLSGNSIDVVLGARTDAWILIDGDVVAAVGGADGGDAQLLSLPISPGQMTIDIRFGQLDAAESGFRFRIAGGDVAQCYPDF